MRAARHRAARPAAARGAVASGGRLAGRRAAPRPQAGVHRRAGSAGRRGRPGPGAAGRPVRRPARHVGGGQGPVPRQPMGPGRQRRLRLAAGRRADLQRRPGRRLGLLAEHVDAAARQADRPGRGRGPGGPRAGRDRRAPSGAARRDGRRRRDRARGDRPAGRRTTATAARPADLAAAPAPDGPGGDAGYRSQALRDRIAAEVHWRDVPYDDEATASGSTRAR